MAEQFSGRARAARMALVDGAPGVVWAPGGQPRVVFRFGFTHGRIARIDILAEREQLDELDLVILNE